MAAPDFPRRPLADKFLYRALVGLHVNAYKCAKFQVPSSISYRDMEGILEYKVGAADLPRRPLAVKLLYNNNNNNNNNNQDNVYGAVIMAEPLREFTRFI